MTLRQKKIFAIAVALLIFGLAAATVIAPKKEYSENENRYLEEFPEFSLSTVMDGSFMENMETYISDHFILRDVFMTIRTRYELLTGRNRVNNIYMCADGFYIEEYSSLKNTERIEAAVKRLAGAAGEQTKLCVMFVPTAVTVYSDKLPKESKNDSQLEDMAKLKNELGGQLADQIAAGNVSFVDVTDALMNAKDEAVLYYRLDHHWTTDGAYFAYRELMKDMGLEPLARGHFQIKTVSADFRGSFYSKVNDLSAQPDAIVKYETATALNVSYPSRNLETDTLYAEEYLEKKDQYSYFLNNQNPFIEITNENAPTDRVLAVVKDSYANCFVPFLAEHFSKIYVFDTRFYRESVTEFVKENGVTDVLFLYNMYTIDTDTGITQIR